MNFQHPRRRRRSDRNPITVLVVVIGVYTMCGGLLLWALA